MTVFRKSGHARLSQLNRGFCIFNLIYGKGMFTERVEFSIDVLIQPRPITLMMHLGCAWSCLSILAKYYEEEFEFCRLIDFGKKNGHTDSFRIF
jgi:hypothetical protein